MKNEKVKTTVTLTLEQMKERAQKAKLLLQDEIFNQAFHDSVDMAMRLFYNSKSSEDRDRSFYNREGVDILPRVLNGYVSDFEALQILERERDRERRMKESEKQMHMG